MRSFWIGIGAVLVFISAVLGIMLVLPPEEQVRLKAEGGPIESASAIGYLVLAIALLFLTEQGFIRRHWHLLVLLCAMASREMDFDKRFTTLGVLKSRFYIGDSVPWDERLLGGGVVLFVLYALWRLVVPNLRTVWLTRWRWDYPVWTVLFAGGFVVFTKAIDGIGRKLAPLGIELSTDVDRLFAVIEEVLELGIPLLLGVGVVMKVVTIRQKRAQG